MKMCGRRQDQDTEGTQTEGRQEVLRAVRAPAERPSPRRGALLRGHLSGPLPWRQSMVIEQEWWTASLSKTLNLSC